MGYHDPLRQLAANAVTVMLKLTRLLDDSEGDIAAYLRRPELRAEADRDLARRSLAGISSYFVLWLVIYFSSELEQANDTLLEFLGFMLAAASVGRLYLSLRFNALHASAPRRWRWLFASGTLVTAAVWGGVCALAIDYDGLGPTSVMVMLATAGIAAGGIVSFAPTRYLGGAFVVFLLLPSVPLALSNTTIPGRGIALLFLTFFLFMFFLWRRLHVEYWRALAGRAELVRAKEAAEAATIAKGQFIANVSHELRTPLTAIIGALGLVESDLPETVPQHTLKLVDMAYQNGIRLSALINDLLDFEKLNAGRMSFNNARMPLAFCVERSIELNRSYADRYHVSLTLSAPNDQDIEVIADEQRLQQVMANLLSNAVKHSPSGGSVEVSIGILGDQAHVAVRDHGTGVPEAFRPMIFSKFAQADGTSTRKNGGTGLGLAISKAIIDHMGGSIGFESITGQGATFYFDRPIAPERPAEPAGE